MLEQFGRDSVDHFPQFSHNILVIKLVAIDLAVYQSLGELERELRQEDY